MNQIDFLHLELHEKVGEGCFGNVWKASYLGTPVAVKECVPSNDEKDAEFLSYFEREVEMLSKSRHPNIVQFLGTCIHDKKFWIVTEYIPCGTMKSWIISGKATSFKTRLSFAIDIARALTYLHSCNVIHRDLKPSNLLITENKRVKICDFGFARLLCRSLEERKRMSFCGTDEYMAPEILQGLPFDESVDVFGFGIILCELASCQVANSRVFSREIPGHCVRAEEVQARATSDCPYQLLDLALRCINGDPRLRPAMGEALGELHALEDSRSSLTSPVSFASPNSKPTQSLSNLPPLMAIQIPDSNISFRLENEAIAFVDSPSSGPSTSSAELKSPRLACTNIPPIHTFKSLLAGDSKDFMGSIGRAAIPKVDATLSMASFSSIDSLRKSHEGLGSRRPATLMLDSSRRGGHGHRFSIREASSHETCLHCHQRLSDFLVSTYAMACEDCGFLCHKRCAPLTPLNCEAPSPALKALASLFNSQPFFLNVDNPPSTI